MLVMKRKRDFRHDLEEEESDEIAGPLAILWDIDNCCIPSGVSPHIVVENTRKYLRRHGIKMPITLFSAYGDFSNRPSVWTESCQWSGVDLIHISNHKKDAADKAILVDMLLLAMDNPPPSSILMISGDVDFAAALHKLAQRGHSVLLAATNLTQTSNALLSSAKFVCEWPQMASNGRFPTNPRQNQTLCGTFKPQSLPDATTKSSPPSLMQHSKFKQSDVDVVKKEILSLIHRKGGSITLGEISLLYEHIYKNILNRKNGCTLRELLEKMGDDIHIHGEGRTSCVYLISQEKSLCPQSNMDLNAPNQKNVTDAGCGLPSETETESNQQGKSLCPQSNMDLNAPNQKNVTDAGCGLPSETETELNQAHLMEVSNLGVGHCPLPSQTTTQPYPISLALPSQTTKPTSTSSVPPTKYRPSDFDVVKKELRTLLSTHRGIRLRKIEKTYEQIFKKQLRVKDYGCVLTTLLRWIGTDIHIQGKGESKQVFLSTCAEENFWTSRRSPKMSRIDELNKEGAFATSRRATKFHSIINRTSSNRAKKKSALTYEQRCKLSFKKYLLDRKKYSS